MAVAQQPQQHSVLGLWQWCRQQWDVVLLALSLVLLIGNGIVHWLGAPQTNYHQVALNPSVLTQFPAQPLPVLAVASSSPQVSRTTKQPSSFSPIQHNVTSKNGLTVNINTASQRELERLPGIGPAMAHRILDYRHSHPQFTKPNDLRPIRGIGRKTVEKLSPYLDF